MNFLCLVFFCVLCLLHLVFAVSDFDLSKACHILSFIFLELFKVTNFLSQSIQYKNKANTDHWIFHPDEDLSFADSSFEACKDKLFSTEGFLAFTLKVGTRYTFAKFVFLLFNFYKGYFRDVFWDIKYEAMLFISRYIIDINTVKLY